MRAKILNASAGSGKTYKLAYKYVKDVVEQPTLYRHILAVTFTNKATEEMKTRILSEIHKLASGKESQYLDELIEELKLDETTIRKRAKEVRSRILHDYSRFTVLTIDTFFQRILRAFIKELGIDLNYNVEIETASVLSKSAEGLIEQITTDDNLRQWLIEFVQERIDQGSKWDIRDGILALGGELFKEKNRSALSMAGSKQQLAEIVGQAAERAKSTKQQMVGLAKHAMEIIAQAGVELSDFSGKTRTFANWFATVAQEQIEQYTPKVGTMSLTSQGWCAKGSPAEPLVAQLQPLLRQMCDIYDTNIRSWNTYELLRENYRSFALLADLYALVQKMCDTQSMMILSETKYILSEFVAENDAPFIYEKVGNRYDHFMIDEFQDTSTREWENFLPLLENAMAQSEATSVLIVGDIKQSIYRWRGGDWRLLHSKAEEALGKENTHTETLDRNFRSLPVVVEFNNQVIGRVVNNDNTALNDIIAQAAERGDMTANEAADLHDTLKKAYHKHEQKAQRIHSNCGYVCVESFEEQPPVVKRICELMDRGFKPCDIMILVSKSSDGAKVAAELLRFKSENNDDRYRFDVMTQEALLVGKAPVASFIAASMRLALNPDDRLQRAQYNNFLGHKFDRELSDQEISFFQRIRMLSPEEAFEQIIIESGLQNNRSQVAYIQAIHEQIITFTANKVADIALFVRWWDEHGQGRSLAIGQSPTTIEITTIHKAKGLEKPAVIIPYCSWRLDPKPSNLTPNIVWAEARGEGIEQLGQFPVKYKTMMAESGFAAEYFREQVYAHVDNVNMLYVALTRAGESLHIFTPSAPRGLTIGKLLIDSMVIDGTSVKLGDIEGRFERLGGCEKYEFGEFKNAVIELKKEQKVSQKVIESYPTAQAKLKLRLQSQRYIEQAEVEIAPRNLGIMMHRAFEDAQTIEQIKEAIRQMVADAVINKQQALEIDAKIDTALQETQIGEWFKGDWDSVRSESQIITPGNKEQRRPDRVMIKGDRAVVVDYKFGQKQDPKHAHQVSEYIELLEKMGYARTEGYIWYVKQGLVVKV